MHTLHPKSNQTKPQTDLGVQVYRYRVYNWLRLPVTFLSLLQGFTSYIRLVLLNENNVKSEPENTQSNTHYWLHKQMSGFLLLSVSKVHNDLPLKVTHTSRDT